MSQPINDGGSAFPVVHAIIPQPGSFTQAPPAMPGMTLRDWFAGQWLTGLGACPETSSSVNEIAKGCYQIADAMLAARTKGGADE